jgi:hypothetical protein
VEIKEWFEEEARSNCGELVWILMSCVSGKMSLFEDKSVELEGEQRVSGIC